MEFTHHDETPKLVNQQQGGSKDSDEGSSDGEDQRQPGKDLRLRAKGRRKIKIEFIPEKTRRQITFSKRKSGLMKKVYELTTLTGTQALLLLASETGHVYSFATPKLQSIITGEDGKNLIQSCLSAPNIEATDPQYQGPTTTVLSGPVRSNTNQPTSGPESDSPPAPKSPPRAPRMKQPQGKASPSYSVGASPPHETSPQSMHSPNLGPGAGSGMTPGSAQHFAQNYDPSFGQRQPQRPEEKGQPSGQYMPYFGHAGQGVPTGFSERPSSVKLESDADTQVPPHQRFPRDYPHEPQPSTTGKREDEADAGLFPSSSPLWNLYSPGPVPPHLQQSMIRGQHPSGPGSPPLAKPQSLENFPGFPLMGNPNMPMTPEMYQSMQHQQMQQMQQMQMQQHFQQQMQHQIQMQQHQQAQEAQRGQQRK